jgi:choline dehydrogenase-like flavoprotein
MPPLRLDRHSALLLERYRQQRSYLNDRLGCYLGRSRVATLSEDRGGRAPCSYLGRCLWGCPTRSLYTPISTLDQCRGFPNFTYVPGIYVSHLRLGASGRIAAAVTQSLDGRPSGEVAGDRFVLAAGTLSSSQIYMRTVRRQTGETIVLRGLMDNRQILVPFLNLSLIGSRYEPDSYQYHQVGMGITMGNPREYVHGQITTLKTALVHPIVQNLPIDLRTALAIFRTVRAGLGVVNVNLRDTRRDDNVLTLAEDRQGRTALEIRYAPPAGEAERMSQALGAVRKALWRLGCVVPPGLSHVRPMGASVHYAGTIPMAADGNPHTASADCQSANFSNLYFVDGTTFPALPAKNLTFTLMANAVRVAAQAF